MFISEMCKFFREFNWKEEKKLKHKRAYKKKEMGRVGRKRGKKRVVTIFLLPKILSIIGNLTVNC